LAAEIEGAADRLLMTALLVALVITLFVVLVALLVAIVVVLVALEVISAGLATAIVAIVGTLATALFGSLLVAAVGAIQAMVAAMPGSDIIGLALPQFSGLEIARRLARQRFHQVLLLQPESPTLPQTATSTVRLSSTTDAEGISEIYQANALGGTYRLSLRLDVT
jgi:hypothetical protein